MKMIYLVFIVLTSTEGYTEKHNLLTFQDRTEAENYYNAVKNVDYSEYVSVTFDSINIADFSHPCDTLINRTTGEKTPVYNCNPVKVKN